MADTETITHQISSTTTSMPSALPTPNSAILDEQISPNQKKLMFKKAKGEDLNK